MKKIIVFCSCITVLLFSSTTFGEEAVNGLYVSAQLGVSIVRDGDLTVGINNYKLEYDKGFATSMAGGYKFGMFRVEGELGYQYNDINKIRNDTASGDVRSLSFLGNGYIDFANSSPFTPYISAGIGIARPEVKDFTIAGSRIGNDSDTVFAYQFGAGVAYSIDRNMAIDLKYRYFGMTDPDFNGVKTEIKSHNIYLGFRYTF